jgi:hypothetical protein
MEPTTQDLVQFALKGDAIKAAGTFNDLIADKIAASIQQRKMELAQQIFNNSQEDEDNPYEEDESDLEDDQDSDLEDEEYEDEEEEEDENS